MTIAEWVQDGDVIDPDLDANKQAAMAYVMDCIQKDFRRELIALLDDHIANYQQRANDLPNNTYPLRWINHTIGELRCVRLLIEKADIYGPTQAIAEAEAAQRAIRYAQADAEAAQRANASINRKLSTSAHSSKDD